MGWDERWLRQWQHGADVVIASRKAGACEAAAAQLAAVTGRRALGVGFHAGRWADAEALADFAYARLGRCDILVNNAGMAPLYGRLSKVSEELFDKVMAVNYRGPFRLSALIAERMAAGDGGSIINVSSIAAVQPRPHELAYAGAKAALNKHDDRDGPGLRAEDPRQRDHGRPVSHRHQRGLGSQCVRVHRDGGDTRPPGR